MEELNKQQIIDEEHLKLLVLFHRIYGIFVIVFSFLGIGYFLLFNFILSISKKHSQFTLADNFQGPPAEFMHIFMIIIGVLILIGLSIGICNLISAQYIKRRKHRIFSIVIAGIDCVSFPLGTILGVLTMVVLLRNTVIEYYKSLESY